MTGSLWGVALAAFVFVASHVLLSSTGARGRLAGAIGEIPFIVLYSAVSVILLGWLIVAYRAAPYVELWAAGTGIRHLGGAVMLMASVLVAAGLTSPNPTALFGERLAAGRPVAGITRITRHPVMWGIGLWAVVHAAANGDIASLVLFGSLAVLALGGTVLIDRKRRAGMGAGWTALAAETSNLPLAALLSGRTRTSPAEIGYWRLALGVVLYLALLFAHEPVIGVWPLWIGS